ncbi:hypothetical protein RFI_20578 [Reticulomyxa filosa]|uniref:Uncharacterized protein n=1 Tax=Reticulomyxa filosa TaxID=46433 RepID=X6MSW6_RETFI|nr:hypothetical protein RFI_20578 [Reticulomyxa filosa]|eukprot:ETO16761.1 hypothetical protein RFI_20578 [Reticulomyxa filosa]
MALHVLNAFVVSNVNLQTLSWNTANGQTYLNNHGNMIILMMSWNKLLNQYFDNVWKRERCTYLQCSKVYNSLIIVLAVENFQQGVDAIRKRKYTSSPKQVHDLQNATKKNLYVNTPAMKMYKSTSRISSTSYTSAFKIIKLKKNVYAKKKREIYVYHNKLEHCKVEVITSTPLPNEACELCKRSGASVELEILFAMKCYMHHIGMNAELNHKYYTLLQQVCYHNVVISNTMNAQFHTCAMSTRKTSPDILQLMSKTAMDFVVIVQWISHAFQAIEVLLVQFTILGENAHDKQLNCKSVTYLTPHCLHTNIQQFVYAMLKSSLGNNNVNSSIIFTSNSMWTYQYKTHAMCCSAKLFLLLLLLL